MSQPIATASEVAEIQLRERLIGENERRLAEARASVEHLEHVGRVLRHEGQLFIRAVMGGLGLDPKGSYNIAADGTVTPIELPPQEQVPVPMEWSDAPPPRTVNVLDG